MIILSHVELIEFCHFGDNGSIPNFLSVQILDQFLGNLLLFLVMVEDGGAILCPSVRALTVQRGGVMDGEEHVQQIPVGNDIRVKVDLHNFSMTCIAIANGAIGGVVHVAAGITRLNTLDSLDLVINGFQTPEASPSQCC